MGDWWLPAVWSVAKYSPCSFIQDCKKAVAERRLMKALENEARATGVTEIGLSISLPSKRFYESLGYKRL
jgi:hypothetical protein